MVERGAKVLDVGCGDGELLRLLVESRGVDGRGIEISREGVNECVAKGLAVIQGDADTDLADYPDDAFDYVILSQTLQATRHPRVVLEHMLRIGRRAVVSFPNFGHWQVRLQLLFAGHMPQTDILPYSWYDTPNIHHCTIKDFRQLCTAIGVKMERAVALNAWGSPLRLNAPVVVLEPVRRAGGVSAQPLGGSRPLPGPLTFAALHENLALSYSMTYFHVFESLFSSVLVNFLMPNSSPKVLISNTRYAFCK